MVLFELLFIYIRRKVIPVVLTYLQNQSTSS